MRPLNGGRRAPILSRCRGSRRSTPRSSGWRRRARTCTSGGWQLSSCPTGLGSSIPTSSPSGSRRGFTWRRASVRWWRPRRSASRSGSTTRSSVSTVTSKSSRGRCGGGAIWSDWRAAISLSSSTAGSRSGRSSSSPVPVRARAALIGKVHHAMVDGIAAVELGTLLFDLAPDAALPEPSDWEPEPLDAPLANRGRRGRRQRPGAVPRRTPGCLDGNRGRVRRCAWRRRCDARRCRSPRT